MSAFSVRVSEDLQRPLGHAIITLTGLPRTLETFEFSLNRHGFANGHLGPKGWQSAEHWLHPEEVWYSGDALKFVIPPEWTRELENMPYQLAVRGQGLPQTVTVTFIWPLELAIEEGCDPNERQAVGGKRVGFGSSSLPPSSSEAPHAVDLPIPEVSIPDLNLQRLSAGEDSAIPLSFPPDPPPSGEGEELPTQVLQGIKGRHDSRTLDPTRPVVGRIASPPLNGEKRVFGTRNVTPSPAPAGGSTPGLSTPPSMPSRPPVALPRDLPLASSPPQPQSVGYALERYKRIGWASLAVLVTATGVGVGGWWFSHSLRTSRFEAPPLVTPSPPPSTAPPLPTAPYFPTAPTAPGLRLAPEPRPAPEPQPAPEPPVAPEPQPAREPTPLLPHPGVPPLSPHSTPRHIQKFPSFPPSPDGEDDLIEKLKSQLSTASQDPQKLPDSALQQKQKPIPSSPHPDEEGYDDLIRELKSQFAPSPENGK